MFVLHASNHAIEIERLQRGCYASGAPDFMWGFLNKLSEKTSFNIRTGTPTMIQPFISGKISREDVLSILSVTGNVLDMGGVSTIQDYQDAISHLYEKLK